MKTTRREELVCVSTICGVNFLPFVVGKAPLGIMNIEYI